MAKTKYHKLGGLKQQKCLEVQHQGIISGVFVHTGPGKSPETENLPPQAEGRERLKKEAEATPAWRLTECTCEGKLTCEARPGQDEVDILHAAWHLPTGSL